MAGMMSVIVQVMSEPWKRGVSDCCTAACDVFKLLHGVDPMEPLRGRYTSRKEADALVEAHGGWYRLAAEMARASGLSPCVPARPGAIGVISVRDEMALAICVRPGLWATKTPFGVRTFRVEPLGAWHVEA